MRVGDDENGGGGPAVVVVFVFIICGGSHGRHGHPVVEVGGGGPSVDGRPATYGPARHFSFNST